MRRGTLYVKVDGEDVPVAPCLVDPYDGGVFTSDESQRSKATVTWRRIGTLPVETMDKINHERNAA